VRFIKSEAKQHLTDSWWTRAVETSPSATAVRSAFTSLAITRPRLALEVYRAFAARTKRTFSRRATERIPERELTRPGMDQHSASDRYAPNAGRPPRRQMDTEYWLAAGGDIMAIDILALQSPPDEGPQSSATASRNHADG
jgi:hypothetical protein